MPKEYQILSNEPLTDFDQSVLKMLNGVAQTGTPKAMAGAVIMEKGEVLTFYHNAEMQDMMVAKGFLELDIQNDNVLGNLPWFLEQAQKEGLIEGYPEDGDYAEWYRFDDTEEDDDG